MLFRTLVLAWAVGGILGCSSVPVRSHPRLAVALHSHRHLELEPCGCSMEDLGGVEREYNALAEWKKNLNGALPLTLASGATFVPFQKFDKKQKKHYLSKAGFVVEAMNLLGVEGLSVSADDLALGLDSVRALEVKAKFKFLSANLANAKTGKALFPASHTYTVGGKTVLVVGLTHVASSGYPLPRDVQVRDPRAGLRIALQSNPKADVVIVLSSLPSSERSSMISAFPEVNLWLGGGSDEDSTYVAIQPSASSLYANSHLRGRGLMTVDIELPSPLGAFFNAKTEAVYRSIRSQAVLSLKAAEKSLASAKDTSSRAKLERAVKDERRHVEELNRYPRSAEASVSIYRSLAIPISSRFSKPSNPLTQLMQEYKKANKRFAMHE